MKEYKYQMMNFYDQEVGAINYTNYYAMRERVFQELEALGEIRTKLKIIRALFRKDTQIILTTLEREDYGCDVGYIVSINVKDN